MSIFFFYTFDGYLDIYSFHELPDYLSILFKIDDEIGDKLWI